MRDRKNHRVAPPTKENSQGLPKEAQASQREGSRMRKGTGKKFQRGSGQPFQIVQGNRPRKADAHPLFWLLRGQRGLGDTDARMQRATTAGKQTMTRDTLLRSFAVRRRETLCNLMPVKTQEIVSLD